MKTSNKLLLGLIIALLLIITLTVGMAKYYHEGATEQSSLSHPGEPVEQSVSMEETETKARVHLPVAFILLPQLQW